jgi:hypothetical protein
MQAAIYQQKALDINEQELGLDHPDTMKSYVIWQCFTTVCNAMNWHSSKYPKSVVLIWNLLMENWFS